MPRNVEEPAPRRPAYFWWLLANLLALCFAVVSWTVCLHVFGNPEIPRNYEILRKLGRLPEIKRHTVLDVPNGNLLDPRGLYAKFFGLTERPAPSASIRSSSATTSPTSSARSPSPTSRATIRSRRSASSAPTDFLPSGFAVRARALVKPDDFTKPAPYPVVIEYLFPTDGRRRRRKRSATGDILSVRKSPNCAAILHAAKILEGDEQLVCLTVIPIAYGPYRVGDDATFNIEPPAEVRPGAELPGVQTVSPQNVSVRGLHRVAVQLVADQRAEFDHHRIGESDRAPGCRVSGGSPGQRRAAA